MKIIFGVAAVVLLGELAWAGWDLTQKPVIAPSSTVKNAPPSVTRVEPKATLSLTSAQNTIKVGQKVAVNINISASKPTDGTDLIIRYDPKVLNLMPNGTAAVKVGTIYGSYPVNKYEDKTGRITVSGISAQGGSVVPQGIFGSLEFTAKAAGKTTISLDFARGSTVDSNIIESKTAKDILTDVKNAEVTIIP